MVRHANYRREALTLGGRYITAAAHAALLTLPLAEQLQGCTSFTLRSSPVAWATETAITLNDRFGWLPEGINATHTAPTLVSCHDMQADVERLSWDARTDWGGRHALIIVTHLEVCCSLPLQIARDLEWPSGDWERFSGLDRGMAVVLDLEQHTMTRVQSPDADV
ncbi:hypothetical protein CL628_01225 [bacterium]|nr:hypothetical protein [bacterium]